MLGLVQGLSVALLAMGLMLVYKASRFVNLAHAQLGIVAAAVLAKIVLDWGIGWWLAFAVAIAVGAVTGVLCDLLVFRRLVGRSRTTLLIASLGVSQLLLACTYFEWLGPDRVELSSRGYPIPFQASVRVDALVLRGHHLLVLVSVPCLALALALFFRHTLSGRAIRGIASNRDAAALAGIPIKRLATLTWLLAGAMSAFSAVLVAPSQPTFDTQALGPSLLLRALGAAAIGGFTNLPLAFGAGVGLGVLELVTLNRYRDPGLSELVVALAILAALLLRSRVVRPTRHGREPADASVARVIVPERLRGVWLVRHRRFVFGALAVAIALLLPSVSMFQSGDKQFVLTLSLTYALLGASIVLLTGWAGQVSLGHYALLGTGAFLAARLWNGGWSLPASVLVAGTAGAIAMVLIGIPSLRLSGLTTAVTSLAFAVVGPTWLFRQTWLVGDRGVLVPEARLPILGELHGQRAVFYTALAALVVVGVIVGSLRRSSVGRRVIAVRDNERAAATLGVSPAVTRVTVFALSGFVAATSGVLWLAAWRSIDVELVPAEQSAIALAVPVIGGLSSVAGAVAGAVAVIALPMLTSDWLKRVFSTDVQFQLFVSGMGLLGTQLRFPGGIVGALSGVWQRLLTWQAPRARAAPAAVVVPTADLRAVVARRAPRRPGGTSIPLRTEGVTVRYGGVVALDQVSIEVRPREVVGLIGANGAGKTTLLDVVSGIVPIERGRVVAFGRDLPPGRPSRRRAEGIARSHQDAALFAELTVRETVQLGLGARNPMHERRAAREADELLAALGLTPWSDARVSELSTGTRRLCDLAAQLATRPGLLLLDEPTAGIAQREAEAFGPLLRSIATALGCAILIVEHDMPLLMGLADRVYCLEAGALIAEGTPEAMRRNDAVIASYLGTSERAIMRSGR